MVNSNRNLLASSKRSVLNRDKFEQVPQFPKIHRDIAKKIASSKKTYHAK